MKRAYIIHGWEGRPDQHWLPWLKNELETHGFHVTVPTMPETETPRIEAWVPKLAELVGRPDTETFLIGHSIGVNTILRYLAGLTGNEQVGGVVCVAGWFNLPNLQTDEEKAIAAPWLEPINYEAVKKHTKSVIAIFSDDDQDVPLNDSKLFEERLGAKIIIEHQKGHFTADDGVSELPAALKAVLELVQD